MKKIAGKIAMILILLMLANSFSGCTFIGYMISELGDGSTWWIIGGLLLDLIAVIVYFGIMTGWDGGNTSGKTDTGIYLAGADHDPLIQYYSVMEILNSLPEMERIAVMEGINSLSETKRFSLVKTVSSLPETEIAASIKRLNALSETELVSVVQGFNALSEAELDALVEEINSRTETENIVSLKNDLQYYNAGMKLCYQ
jgi:hypothetical protein